MTKVPKRRPKEINPHAPSSQQDDSAPRAGHFPKTRYRNFVAARSSTSVGIGLSLSPANIAHPGHFCAPARTTPSNRDTRPAPTRAGITSSALHAPPSVAGVVGARLVPRKGRAAAPELQRRCSTTCSHPAFPASIVCTSDPHRLQASTTTRVAAAIASLFQGEPFSWPRVYTTRIPGARPVGQTMPTSLATP